MYPPEAPQTEAALVSHNYVPHHYPNVKSILIVTTFLARSHEVR